MVVPWAQSQGEDRFFWVTLAQVTSAILWLSVWGGAGGVTESSSSKECNG